MERCRPRRSRGVLLAGIVQVLVSVFAAHALAQAPPAEASIAATLSDSGRMLVPVTIGGAGPYPFIVDTAAERSVIAQQLADTLGLRPAARLRLMSLTSTREVATVEIPGLSFLPGDSRDLRAFTVDGANVRASGVLGIDALRGQRVVLDFETHTMRVGPAPRREERPADDEIVVRARLRFGQLVLADCNIDGQAVDVIVDSGSEVSVGNEALRRALTTRRSTFEQIALLGITGETLQVDYTRADRLVIGGLALVGMPVAFAHAHFFTRLKLTRRPAMLLGMDALRMFARVSVDFPNHEARFVLPDKVEP